MFKIRTCISTDIILAIIEQNNFSLGASRNIIRVQCISVLNCTPVCPPKRLNFTFLNSRSAVRQREAENGVRLLPGYPIESFNIRTNGKHFRVVCVHVSLLMTESEILVESTQHNYIGSIKIQLARSRHAMHLLELLFRKCGHARHILINRNHTYFCTLNVFLNYFQTLNNGKSFDYYE